MQEEDKSVDIDTSGPDVEVELPQETKENEKEEVVVEQATEDKTNDKQPETKLEDGGIAGDSSEKPVEQPAVQEDNKQKSEGKEAEEYSEGVKKRIAKLTKKMREAERQREEALRYAESVKRERDEFKTQANTLDKDYTTEMENRISGQLAAAQAKLTAARQNDDAKSETEALTAISQLGYEQGRLAELKTQNEMREKAAKEDLDNNLLINNNPQLSQIQKLRHGQVKMSGLEQIQP